MSPYVIFGPSHRCFLKNLLNPPKNLFQQHRSFATDLRWSRNVHYYFDSNRIAALQR
jgi:hypothetical protein